MAVFHLKYRPQSLADLDQLEVAKTLESILVNDDIPQSWLFCGPKGSGKTSTARIVAKILNCTQKKGAEACNECENCKAVEQGSCLDIMELDAASNRGIEDVRNLKDKAYLAPMKLAKKVFIVDEVHMMTKEAFNALLKLIEEPPKQTVFIMCTTDPQKIPETILSRLIKIEFKKGNRAELKKSVRRIVEGEGIEIDEEAIEEIINHNDGSFRNLQKTVNELFLSCGKKILIDEVKKYFLKKLGDYQFGDFENDLEKGVGKIIIDRLEKMADGGIDFKNYREELTEYFHSRMLFELGLGEVSGTMSLKNIEKWINCLIVAGKQEKDINIGQLPLQLAVIEFLGVKEERPNDKLQITNEEVEEKIEPGIISTESLRAEWSKVLEVVKPVNHSVEAFLRATRPKKVNGNTVIIEVFYPFHRDKLNEDKNRKVVEMGLKEIFKNNLEFKCVLGQNKTEAVVITNETEEKNEVPKTENELYDVAKEIFG
ncbi:MAG TPA: DNA polymerase III subunit gamma/tau [Candidatus Woesebacteria bacterium]|nr:DNA polymerase III subunit gamma/tau [Candidatus Woesebacteria bacterium]